MGKRQLRRTVSMTVATYSRLRQLGELREQSMAAVVEHLIAREADRKGIQVDPEEERRRALEAADERELSRLERAEMLRREAFG